MIKLTKKEKLEIIKEFKTKTSWCGCACDNCLIQLFDFIVKILNKC
jgi:hypothetical protein